MKLSKKILSSALVGTLALGIVGTGSFLGATTDNKLVAQAATINPASWSDFQSAITNASSPIQIKLTQDIVATSADTYL